MTNLHFEPYALDAADPAGGFRAQPPSAVIFGILYTMLLTVREPEPDLLRLRLIARLQDTFETLLNTAAGEPAPLLRREGGVISLEHAELSILKELWTRYRQTLPAASARATLLVEDFLSGARE